MSRRKITARQGKRLDIESAYIDAGQVIEDDKRFIRKRFEIDDVTEKFSVAHFGDCNRNDDIY